jgi:hypothetical protein
MRSYLTEFVEHHKSVIPVLLEGCSDQPKLPIFLKHFTWVDLRDGQYDDGFGRLVWGITGKKPTFSARSQAGTLIFSRRLGPDPSPQLTSPIAQPAEPFSILRHPLPGGGLGPEMVLIPAGEFRMGDLDGSGNQDEKPVHRVRIARPFYLGRYAVTFEEYYRYIQAVGTKPPGDEG